MDRWVGAGRKCRMPNHSFGIGVAMMRIDVKCAVIQQQPEAALAKARRVTVDQISAQLVHGDLQNQTDRFVGCLRMRRCNCECQKSGSNDKATHVPTPLLIGSSIALSTGVSSSGHALALHPEPFRPVPCQQKSDRQRR